MPEKEDHAFLPMDKSRGFQRERSVNNNVIQLRPVTRVTSKAVRHCDLKSTDIHMDEGARSAITDAVNVQRRVRDLAYVFDVIVSCAKIHGDLHTSNIIALALSKITEEEK